MRWPTTIEWRGAINKAEELTDSSALLFQVADK
jgi:hypothetical protein